MQLILKVAIAFGIGVVLGFESSVHDYDDDYVAGMNVREQLEPYRKWIDEWYGASRAKYELWDLFSLRQNDSNCHLDFAWVLDDARKTLLAKENNELNDTQKQVIIDTMQSIIKEELEKSNEIVHCRSLFEELSKSRSHIDCALSRRQVTNYFTNLFPPTDCKNFAKPIWEALVRVGDFSQKCSTIGVYNDLVRMAQIAKGKYTQTFWNTKKNVQMINVMASMAETISLPEHLKYLNRIACPNQPVTSNCGEISDHVFKSICGVFTMLQVQEIETLVKKASITNPFSTADDMLVTMEIMQNLTNIVEEMSGMKILERNVHAAADSRQ